MRDLFDEFLEELQRRQRGESPTDPTNAAADHPSGSDPDAANADEPAADASDDADTDADAATEPEDDSDATSPDRGREQSSRRGPEDLAARRRQAARRGGRGRGPGGPNDGASLRSRFGRFGRRAILVIIAVVLILLLTVAGSGVDLWTDAIWFKSVGFDGVFWTRIDAQFALFLVGAVVGLVVLLGTLWLAGRFAPPPNPDGRGSFAALFDRLTEAGTAAGERGGYNAFSARGGGNSEGARNRGRSGFDGGFRGRVGPSGPGDALDLDDIPDLVPLGRWILLGVGVLLAIGVGVSLGGAWETILLWLHQVPFGTGSTPVTDPVFGRDIGFFLFELPFLRLVQGVVNGILLAALFLTLGRYALAAMRGSLVFGTKIRLHLAVLGGFYLLSVAAGYQLDKFDLVYSTQGVATGVSYTDFNARFFAFDALTLIAGLSAALLVGGAFTKLLWPLGLAVGAWILAAVLLSGVYPQLVQRFSVDPNKFAQEQQFIAYNIKETQIAYGIDTWTTSDYAGDTPLTPAAVQAESATFQNARLWDFAPLGATLDQIQTVRTYYDFTDVDTDRYNIDGVMRQVMVSGRELAQERAPSTSWVNQKLTYTHGIGAAMVPVNEVTPEGLPHLLIHDMPPVSDPSVPTITQPQIYFGERSSDYVVTGAKQPEFDYPSSSGTGGTDTGAQTSWTGTTGISLDSTLSRLLFALRFRDLNLLISDQITSNSQLLMNRTLSDRVQQIAPFLQYDNDPYLVIGNDGKLYYIQDAYTTSDKFPNAQAIDTSSLPATNGLAGTDLDYVRNSVKVVMNAYDGTMSFYAADPADPILRAYEGVFPTLFKPLSDMPADLQAHLRVPEDLFDVQTRMYASYHVTDPETFFRGSDQWTVPDSAGTADLPANEPNYVEMRLPGQSAPEFLLLQPMVPSGRPNMIAWVAARNDAPNYGQVQVFRFPQDTAVRGPNQIEAQIQADPVISAQFTLWNQSGSHVVPGHLIVVPVQNSIVYLEPIFLQSTQSAFPAFQKIIAATSTKIVWGGTLNDALASLTSGVTSPPPPSTPPGQSAPPGSSPSPGASGPPTPAPSGSTGPIASGSIPPPPTGDVAAIVAYANFHFEQAQLALRAGDFARYGQEIAAVQAALAELSQVVGTPAPSVAPASLSPVASPSPSP
jgi:uncharacterized membrane protein (UPF0182 family)